LPTIARASEGNGGSQVLHSAGRLRLEVIAFGNARSVEVVNAAVREAVRNRVKGFFERAVQQLISILSKSIFPVRTRDRESAELLVRSTFNFPRFVHLHPCQHFPIAAVAITLGADLSKPLIDVAAGADLDEFAGKRAHDVNITVGAVSRLETDALRVTLKAMTRARLQSVSAIPASVTENNVLFGLLRPLLPSRFRHPARVVHVAGSVT
jgi:hypothetical protein